MIHIVLAIIIAFAVMTFTGSLLGYVVHWIFHQPWSGTFYRSHQNHHTLQYPPDDFLSETYRSAGRDNSTWLFIIAFSPVIIGIVLFVLFGIISFITGSVALVSLIGWGLINDYFHDHIHLINTPWKPLVFFKKWRDLHRIHHSNMNLNMGIILFQWDKLFGTYLAELETNKGDTK